METPKTHLVMLASPGMGHLVPLFLLSRRLVTLHNLNVTFFIIPTTTSAAESQLIQTSTLPSGLQLVYLQPVNTVNMVGMSVISSIDMIFKNSLLSFHSHLANMATLPTALVVDLFGTPAFDIADQFKIPKYVLVTTSAWFFALTMQVPTLDHEVEGEYVNLTEPIQVPGCKSVRVEDIVDPMLDRKDESYRIYVGMALAFRMADGLLLNTWEDLEPKTLNALRCDPILRQTGMPRLYPIGPVVTITAVEHPKEATVHECLAWLQKQPNESVLFVSFGSGGTLSQEQMTEIAWGLERSQQRFIWVVRLPVAKNVAGSFFSAGSRRDDPSEYLPEGFLTRIEGVGMVVPEWAPQVDILSHPSIGGFLSHCGWNSTLESIINGVPMIAWPLYAEQKMNATMLVEDLDIAIRSEVSPIKGVVSREEIERMVRLLMEGTKGQCIRARINDIKSSALKAIAKDGSSYNTLSKLVNEWEITPQMLAPS